MALLGITKDINVTSEDVSVKCNNDDEIIKLNNENHNETINKINTTSNINNEQLLEPAVNTSITLRRPNCIRNRPNYLKDFI